MIWTHVVQYYLRSWRRLGEGEGGSENDQTDKKMRERVTMRRIIR